MSIQPEELFIDLPKAVIIGGADPIERLVLREPTAGEMGKASSEPAGLRQVIKLVSVVAKIPVAAVESMPISVVDRAGKYLLGFTQAGPEIGEN